MKEIPGFEIIGPRYMGMLDQWVTMGWKRRNELGFFGDAVQLQHSSKHPLSDAEVEWRTKQFMNYGAKGHRRFTAKVRHLWFYVWRQKGEIATFEMRIKDMENTWLPIPSRLGVVQRIAWRIVYREKYQEPFSYD